MQRALIRLKSAVDDLVKLLDDAGKVKEQDVNPKMNWNWVEKTNIEASRAINTARIKMMELSNTLKRK